MQIVTDLNHYFLEGLTRFHQLFQSHNQSDPHFVVGNMIIKFLVSDCYMSGFAYQVVQFEDISPVLLSLLKAF